MSGRMHRPQIILQELQRQAPNILRKNENVLFAWEVNVLVFTLITTLFWMFDTFTPYFDRWVLVIRGVCSCIFLIDLGKAVMLSVLLKKRFVTWLGENIHQIFAAVAISLTFTKIATLNANLPSFDFLYILKVGFFWFVLKQRLLKRDDVSPIGFALIEAVVTVFVLSITFSGFFIVVENNLGTTNYNFFDGFYFIIVTFSTVGYGDRYAYTQLGRVVSILAILVGVAIIGSTLTQIATFASERRKFEQFRGRFDKATDPHIIICGDVTFEKLKTILSELYEGNRGKSNATKVVVLGTEPPTQEMENYLNSSFLSTVVKFLVGDVKNPADLERISLCTAGGCFIVNDGESEAEDAETVMRALNISKFVKLNIDRLDSVGKKMNRPSILCQMYNKKFQKYVARKGVNSLCLGELKALVLGYNTIVPGFSTFISTLCLSFSLNVSNEDPQWKKDFQAGIDQEIFSVHIDPTWLAKGKTFAEVSFKIYEETASLCIALVTKSETEEHVILNPSFHYQVTEDDVFYVVGEDITFLKGCIVPINKERVTFQQLKDFKITEKSYEHLGVSEDSEEFEKYNAPLIPEKGEPTEILELSKWDPHRLPFSVEQTSQYSSNYQNGIKKISRWRIDHKKDHLIVTGDFSMLEYIIKTLRDNDLPLFKHIVLLGMKPPAQRFWKHDDDLKKVYYVMGDPTSTYDWRKCSVKTASHALILSSKTSNRNDSQTILSYLACKEEAGPNTFITTDLANESSIQYLDNNSESFWVSKSFLAGRAFCDSVFDRALVCCHYNSHLMDLLSLMITRQTSLEQDLQSWLVSMDVPAPFQGKEFIEFFRFSCLFGVVPVALYRTPSTTTTSTSPLFIDSDLSEEEVDPEYTYTNPYPWTVLKGTDKLMLLIPYVLIVDREQLNKLKSGNLDGSKAYSNSFRGLLHETYEEDLDKWRSQGPHQKQLQQNRQRQQQQQQRRQHHQQQQQQLRQERQQQRKKKRQEKSKGGDYELIKLADG